MTLADTPIAEERWLPIEGAIYEHYISSHGRVKSTKHRKAGGSEYIRYGYIGKIGYPTVCIRIGDTLKPHYVHALVAKAFLGDCPQGMEVNHKDHNRTNNHVDNLEYVSHRENVQAAAAFGRVGKYVRSAQQLQKMRELRLGVPPTNRKLSRRQAAIIRRSGKSHATLAMRFGVSKKTVFNIKHGRIYNC